MITKKVYIGVTKFPINERLSKHIYSATSGSNFHLHRSMRKHGKENFHIDLIFYSFEEDHAYEYEKYFIKEYKANNPKFGYNMTPGGEHPLNSIEVRNKISKAKKGKKFSKEHKNNLSIARRKRVTKQSTREKLSKSLSGLKRSNKFKQKMSKTAKEKNYRKNLIEHNEKKKKPVICVELQKSFSCCREAGLNLNINYKNIQSVLKGRRKRAGGYQFKYV